MAQLVALMSGVVLGGVAEVVGSNLARGKMFKASIGSVDSLSIGSVDSLYPSVYIHIYIYIPEDRKPVDNNRNSKKIIHVLILFNFVYIYIYIYIYI